MIENAEGADIKTSEIREIKGKHIQIGVKLLAHDGSGRYLLIRKNPEIYDRDAWEIPGGRMGKDEKKTLEALGREFWEETGLELLDKPKYVYQQRFHYKKEERLEIRRLTYLAQVVGEVTLSSEHTEHKWATVEDMRQMESLEPLVKELIELGLIN